MSDGADDIEGLLEIDGANEGIMLIEGLNEGTSDGCALGSAETEGF